MIDMGSYKCYSVRLKELTRISGAAFKAVGFDGSEAIIPASQIFGRDLELSKTDAYWISAWILEKRELTYSINKKAWIDGRLKRDPEFEVRKRKRKDGIISINRHNPAKIKAKESNEIASLKSDKS